jgi:hydroxymethylglutaryl-CoA synthase
MTPYVSNYYVSAEEMEKNGLKATHFLQKQNAVWDCNEDAISMALTAVQRLLEQTKIDPNDIGRLEVGTESNVDMAKSIKTYLMQLFPTNPELEGVDNVSACYGGTQALLNTLNWLRAGVSPKRYGIVVATDTAYMDEKQMSWQGCGAMAMLVGDDPAIEILPEYVTYMANNADFFQPRRSQQLSPYLDGRGSMECYLTAMQSCTEKMEARHGRSLTSVDAIAVHGGVCKSVIVKACNEWSKWAGMSKTQLLNLYDSSSKHAELLGAQYTASLYFNLHSYLEHGPRTFPANMLLFSYGSGSAAALLSAVVHRLPDAFAPLEPVLARRTGLTFEQASRVAQRHREGDEAKADLSVLPGVFHSVQKSLEGGRVYARA